jgi:hypothetical protein
MVIKNETIELEERIVHMRALQRTVTDERALRAISDIIDESNRRLDMIAPLTRHG